MSRLPVKDVAVELDQEVLYFSYVDELPLTAVEIGKASQKDPILARVNDFVMSGWPNHVENEDLKPYFIRRNELSAEQNCVM